jgi:hypothetical protein
MKSYIVVLMFAILLAVGEVFFASGDNWPLLLLCLVAV